MERWKFLVNFAVDIVRTTCAVRQNRKNRYLLDMKKTFNIVRLAMACVLLATVSSLTSCKKEATDTSGLLSTVPSSAGAVIGFNVKSLLEKAGCEVDGSSITPGAAVQSWLTRQANSTDGSVAAMRAALSGESGIDPVGAIVFIDAYESYMTAMVADTGKFMEFVEKQTGSKFTETEGVKTCGNVALSGAQMWMSISSASTIDAKAVRSYSSLDESQSFMSDPFARKIADMTDDIVGFVRTGFLTSGRGASFSDAATAKFALGLLFEDASALTVRGNFLKGRTEVKAEVLNAKGEKAKFLLPTSKIDTGLVKSLGTTAEMVCALSLSKDLTKKIEQAGSSLGGNMFAEMMKLYGSIDGTIAGAFSDLNNPQDGLSAAVTTDGNPSNEMMQFLSQFGATKKEGNVIRITSGTPKEGGIELAKAADFCKGAMLAIMVNVASPEFTSGKEGVKVAALSLSPEEKGIVLKVDLEGTEPDENMLVTLINNDK